MIANSEVDVVHGAWCESKVFATNCRDCAKRIFIFTCNCECSVLFDDLGAPWPKHLCAQYLIRRHGFSPQQVDEMVRHRAAQLGAAMPEIDHLFQQTLVAKKDWEVPIERVNPSGKKRRVIGILREKPLGVDTFKRLKVGTETIQGRQVSRHLPPRVTQLTLHAGTVGATKSESFTFWLRGKTSTAELKVGRLVAVELEAVAVAGIEPVWVADDATLFDNPFNPA